MQQRLVSAPVDGWCTKADAQLIAMPTGNLVTAGSRRDAHDQDGAFGHETILALRPRAVTASGANKPHAPQYTLRSIP